MCSFLNLVRFWEKAVHVIQAGVVIGFSGLVDRMIEKTEEELQENLTIIATGGFSDIFALQSSQGQNNWPNRI